jgi:hypothetical protein
MSRAAKRRDPAAPLKATAMGRDYRALTLILFAFSVRRLFSRHGHGQEETGAPALRNPAFRARTERTFSIHRLSSRRLLSTSGPLRLG